MKDKSEKVRLVLWSFGLFDTFNLSGTNLIQCQTKGGMSILATFFFYSRFIKTFIESLQIKKLIYFHFDEQDLEDSHQKKGMEEKEGRRASCSAEGRENGKIGPLVVWALG